MYKEPNPPKVKVVPLTSHTTKDTANPTLPIHTTLLGPVALVLGINRALWFPVAEVLTVTGVPKLIEVPVHSPYNPY